VSEDLAIDRVTPNQVLEGRHQAQSIPERFPHPSVLHSPQRHAPDTYPSAFEMESNDKNIQDTINKRSFSKMNVVNWYRRLDVIFEVEKVIFQRLDSSIRNRTLLDIGIGGGRTTKYLIEISKDYTGIDYTPEFVRVVSHSYPDATILHADARDLRMFSDGSFDFALFSYNGIDYVPHEDRLRAFSEIYRVLKPLSYFMFSTHNRGYERIHNLPWHEDTLLNPAHLRNCLSALVHWPKHLMMKQHEFYNSEYAVVNDSANGFSLLTYYIQIDAQLKQLQNTGFDNIEVYNMKGNRVERDADFPWTYYLAAKTVRPKLRPFGLENLSESLHDVSALHLD
jgi:SAM-dependent methyltransferase